MKNFDDGRKDREARTFQIGGEQFTARGSVRPEAFEEFSDIRPAMPAQGVVGTSGKEVHRIVDDLVLKILDTSRDPGAPDRWRALRAREDDPITEGDLLELCQWFMEITTGRPTGQPGASTNGAAGTGTTTTGGSSSPVEPTVLPV